MPFSCRLGQSWLEPPGARGDMVLWSASSWPSCVAASASTHTLPDSGEGYSPGVRTEYKGAFMEAANMTNLQRAPLSPAPSHPALRAARPPQGPFQGHRGGGAASGGGDVLDGDQAGGVSRADRESTHAAGAFPGGERGFAMSSRSSGFDCDPPGTIHHAAETAYIWLRPNGAMRGGRREAERGAHDERDAGRGPGPRQCLRGGPALDRERKAAASQRHGRGQEKGRTKDHA